MSVHRPVREALRLLQREGPAYLEQALRSTAHWHTTRSDRSNVPLWRDFEAAVAANLRAALAEAREREETRPADGAGTAGAEVRLAASVLSFYRAFGGVRQPSDSEGERLAVEAFLRGFGAGGCSGVDPTRTMDGLQRALALRGGGGGVAVDAAAAAGWVVDDLERRLHAAPEGERRLVLGPHAGAWAALACALLRSGDGGWARVHWKGQEEDTAAAAVLLRPGPASQVLATELAPKPFGELLKQVGRALPQSARSLSTFGAGCGGLVSTADLLLGCLLAEAKTAADDDDDDGRGRTLPDRRAYRHLSVVSCTDVLEGLRRVHVAATVPGAPAAAAGLREKVEAAAALVVRFLVTVLRLAELPPAGRTEEETLFFLQKNGEALAEARRPPLLVDVLLQLSVSPCFTGRTAGAAELLGCSALAGVRGFERWFGGGGGGGEGGPAEEVLPHLASLGYAVAKLMTRDAHPLLEACRGPPPRPAECRQRLEVVLGCGRGGSGGGGGEWCYLDEVLESGVCQEEADLCGVAVDPDYEEILREADGQGGGGRRGTSPVGSAASVPAMGDGVGVGRDRAWEAFFGVVGEDAEVAVEVEKVGFAEGGGGVPAVSDASRLDNGVDLLFYLLQKTLRTAVRRLRQTADVPPPLLTCSTLRRLSYAAMVGGPDVDVAFHELVLDALRNGGGDGGPPPFRLPPVFTLDTRRAADAHELREYHDVLSRLAWAFAALEESGRRAGAFEEFCAACVGLAGLRAAASSETLLLQHADHYKEAVNTWVSALQLVEGEAAAGGFTRHQAEQVFERTLGLGAGQTPRPRASDAAGASSTALVVHDLNKAWMSQRAKVANLPQLLFLLRISVFSACAATRALYADPVSGGAVFAALRAAWATAFTSRSTFAATDAAYFIVAFRTLGGKDFRTQAQALHELCRLLDEAAAAAPPPKAPSGADQVRLGRGRLVQPFFSDAPPEDPSSSSPPEVPAAVPAAARAVLSVFADAYDQHPILAPAGKKKQHPESAAREARQAKPLPPHKVRLLLGELQRRVVPPPPQGLAEVTGTMAALKNQFRRAASA